MVARYSAGATAERGVVALYLGAVRPPCWWGWFLGAAVRRSMSTSPPRRAPYRVLLHESGRYPAMNGARRHPWYRRTVMTVEIVTTVLSAAAVFVGFCRMMGPWRCTSEQ